MAEEADSAFSVNVSLEIVGEEARPGEVSEDADLVELAHAAYRTGQWPRDCMLALVNTPVTLKDGTRVHFRKSIPPGMVDVNFIYQTWDHRLLSVDLKVGREEPLGSFGPGCAKP
jgi:hypothetical protein